MKLRRLEEKDAPYMLEWMHDEELVRYMNKDFSSMKLENCLAFIKKSLESETDIHFAVVDSNDEYQGTASLKNIRDKKAEFGIVVRRNAMGQGLAAEGMKKILQYGFDKLSLEFVFWCVDTRNQRAISFYDKNKYHRTEYEKLNAKVDYEEELVKQYVWYRCMNPKVLAV